MKKFISRMAIVGGMLALTALPVKAQKWEHLADTPQMGWSTWNKFQGNITEDIIKGIADAMVETGLRHSGHAACDHHSANGGYHCELQHIHRKSNN